MYIIWIKEDSEHFIDKAHNLKRFKDEGEEEKKKVENRNFD